MNIESMRKDFEARFPVPDGVVYQPDYNFYAGMDGYQNVARHYDAKFEAWQAAKEQAVPEGWQLVPKEPTVDMRHAGARSIRFEMPGLVRDIYIATRGYKAMLAAAPEAA